MIAYARAKDEDEALAQVEMGFYCESLEEVIAEGLRAGQSVYLLTVEKVEH